MRQVQNDVPVLFDLLLSVEKHPQHLMSSVLDTLVKKAAIPFEEKTTCEAPQLVLSDNERIEKKLSYFPNLPRKRERRYEADKNTKEKICTKKGTGHPSLLPGIFTIFCQHGTLTIITSSG